MTIVVIIEDSDIALNLVRDGFRNDPARELLFATHGEYGPAVALQHLHDLSAICIGKGYTTTTSSS